MYSDTSRQYYAPQKRERPLYNEWQIILIQREIEQIEAEGKGK